MKVEDFLEITVKDLMRHCMKELDCRKCYLNNVFCRDMSIHRFYIKVSSFTDVNKYKQDISEVLISKKETDKDDIKDRLDAIE